MVGLITIKNLSKILISRNFSQVKATLPRRTAWFITINKPKNSSEPLGVGKNVVKKEKGTKKSLIYWQFGGDEKIRTSDPGFAQMLP